MLGVQFYLAFSFCSGVSLYPGRCDSYGALVFLHGFAARFFFTQAFFFFFCRSGSFGKLGVKTGMGHLFFRGLSHDTLGVFRVFLFPPKGVFFSAAGFSLTPGSLIRIGGFSFLQRLSLSALGFENLGWTSQGTASSIAIPPYKKKGVKHIHKSILQPHRI